MNLQCLVLMLSGVLLAGCGDPATESELAQTRSALREALVAARLAEVRVSTELYLELPGDTPDLDGYVGDLHHSLEIGSAIRARTRHEAAHLQVTDQLEFEQTAFVRSGGDPGAVATPRRTAFTLGAERARYWLRTAAVAERHAAALIAGLQSISAADAPAQRTVASVRTELAAIRSLIEGAFGSAEGDVGFATREQFAALEARLTAAIGVAGAIDPKSIEPVPSVVVADVRAVCESAIGAVKFWRMFSLPNLAGTQRSELTTAATRRPFGWLEIAAKHEAPESETAELVAELLGIISVLHGGERPALPAGRPLTGLEGWHAEVVDHGLPPDRVRAFAARLRDWFGD